MPARKRGRDEMEAAASTAAEPSSLITRLRNTWYFANVFQFIQLFGPALNVTQDFDIEDFEEECLKPGLPERLAEIAHMISKYCGGQNDRGPLDERARRAYIKRRPAGDKPFENPFGDTPEEGKGFATMDIFIKLRVMQEMSRWVFDNAHNDEHYMANKFKKKMENSEQKEESWRIDEFGWDAEDRAYYLLDDNRLYRRTPAPPQLPTPSPSPPPRKSTTKAKSKAKSKTKAAPPKPRASGTRRSLRGRAQVSEEPEPEPEEEATEDTPEVEVKDEAAETPANVADTNGNDIDDGLGGDKWECLCITLKDYEDFLESIRKSRDANEKVLYKRLMTNVLPIIQEAEEERARKVAKRQRDLMVMEKLATAKRSSRLAGKAAKEQEEQETREAEEKREADLRAARKEAERQKQMDEDRVSRMQTREQRIKEREHKRILQEEELRRLEEEQEKMENGEIDAKKSERQLKADLKKKQAELEQLEEEEETWEFDCAKCGIVGKNPELKDENIIQCEECSIWQHLACLGLTQDAAEKDGFHFTCGYCKGQKDNKKRQEEDKKKPKIKPLVFHKISSPSQSKQAEDVRSNKNSDGLLQATTDQPAQQKRKAAEVDSDKSKLPPMKKFKPTPPRQPSTQANGAAMHNALLNGPTLSPQGQIESLADGTRPPGLVSPQRASHTTQPMQFGPPLHPNGSQATANGHSPQKPAAGPRTPAQNDPFRNTFASQAPGSSQSRVSPYSGPAPTAQGVTRMAPPQTTPNSSFSGNGSFQHLGPSTPAQQASVPQKQSFAAPSPAPSTNLQASSPPMAPPLRPDAASAGLSPVKNSPPRPTSRDVNLTPVVPPTQKLIPSPKQTEQLNLTGAESPVKPHAPQPAPAS